MESKKVVIMDDGDDSDENSEIDSSPSDDIPEEPSKEVDDSQDSDTPVDPSED